MRKRSVGLTGIVLTVWFSERIFLSISISFGIISGNFDIFEQKKRLRSEYMLFTRLDE